MTISLPDFQNSRILIVGDIMLDRYWSGTTNRISPEAPVPVVHVGDIEDRLGGAANVAKNISALGCTTELCGVLGNDDAGRKIKTLLKDANINDLTISAQNKSTITKLRVMSRHQQLLRMDFEEHLKLDSNSTIKEALEESLKKVDAVIISDYEKGTITDPKEIIELCNKNNTPVFVDPKGKDFSRYHGASFITPNFSELESAVGTCPTLDIAFAKADTLRKDLDIQGILVTLSERGMALIEKNKEPFHMATAAKDVFDVTGAGDTVIATLCAAIASGSDTPNAVRLANLAAGVVVGKLGTSSVSKKDLESALQQEDKDLPKGIIKLEDLEIQLNICRKNGEKIVFTNGCFDLLHAGHIRYLKRAAALGDKLIVGMNGDSSIARLKGPKRPIVTLDERMEVMAALNCIDWVISFDDDTPLPLIEAIKPEVLAKGGDYVAKNIVGYKEVTEAGGSVVVLPFVEGCSTTSIVEKIKSLS